MTEEQLPDFVEAAKAIRVLEEDYATLTALIVDSRVDADYADRSKELSIAVFDLYTSLSDEVAAINGRIRQVRAAVAAHRDGYRKARR